jgi:hypothetical protein
MPAVLISGGAVFFFPDFVIVSSGYFITGDLWWWRLQDYLKYVNRISFSGKGR